MVKLTAGWARLVRAIAATGVSGLIVSMLQNFDPIKEEVVDILDRIPQVDSPEAMAVWVVAGLSAALQAADKFLRDSGYIPEYLEDK